MGEGLLAAMNFLNDGIALVTRNGGVMFATDSARQFLVCDEGTRVLSQFSPVRRALESLHDDSSLPFRFSIQVSGKDDMPAYAEGCVFAVPLENAFLVVLRNQSEAMLYAMLFHNTMEMLSSNLTVPVNALVNSVRRAEALPQGSREIEIIKDALAKAKAVSEGSENLIELAKMLGHYPFVGDERIPAADLFGIIMSRVEHIAAERGLSLRTSSSQAWLPAIYGSSKWLTRSIEEHLMVFLNESGEARTLLAQAAPSESGFAMSFRVEEAPVPGVATRGRGRDLQTDFHAFNAPHLSIYRHILKLHGFRIRLNRDRENQYLEILFEFREPQPNRPEPGIGPEQAQNYARDFVRLYQVLKRERQHEPAG